MPRYNPAAIEPKWQKYWEENRTFATPRLPKGPKILRARHVSLPQRGRAARRPPGRLHGHRHRLPLSADAGPERNAPDGLGRLRPARRATCQADRRPSPRSTTEKNIANFRRQLKMLGFSYDWQRELATTDPKYFRWTQFIFLVLFDTWFDAAAQRGRPHRRAAHSRGSRPRKASAAVEPIATSAGWPINWKRRSTGVRPWAPCWPTRRSRAA